MVEHDFHGTFHSLTKTFMHIALIHSFTLTHFIFQKD